MTSLLEKRVARAVVGASYKLAKRLQTGVYRVAGSIRSIGRSFIKASIIGARQHLAVAIAFDLATLLALIIASAYSFVFRGPLKVGQKGHL